MTPHPAEPKYFGYHPVGWRLTLLVTALVSLGLAIWATVGWVRGQGALEAARALLSLALLGAILKLAHRLRPRRGWGVVVGPTALTVAGPTDGHIDIPWSALREIRRIGRSRNTLVLFLNDERQVLVARQLFSKRRDFEALVEVIEEKMPALPYDA